MGTLLPRFDCWCEALRAIRPGLVVADFAPTALLAARALGIWAVTTGTPFVMPPSAMSSFPDLLSPSQAGAHGTVLSDAPSPDEVALLNALNEMLGPRGLPRLSRLPEAYATDLELVADIAERDPYARFRHQPLLLPLERLSPLRQGRGAEVFIYLSTPELMEPAIRDALRQLPYPARLVAPGLTADLARDLAANPSFRIEPAPLSPATIVALARVILCAGQAGTPSLGVLAGCPVLALPIQIEQFSNALRASRTFTGVRMVPRKGRNSGAILDTLAELWPDVDVARAAGQDARRLRARYPETAEASYRRLLLPLLRDRASPLGPRKV